MATAFEDRHERPALPGRCDCEGQSMAVAITRLTAEGCVLEARNEWVGAADFVHLQIAGTIDMNGRLDWVQGRRAQMRFFGQVHPAAIAKLLDLASR